MNLAQGIDLGRLETFFVRLIDAGPDGMLALAAVGAAIGVGAAHALAPGHAKTITAAYLVGDRGRIRDAVAVGAIVAVMHTGTVLTLGLLLHGAVDRPITPDQLTPWMAITSGLLVIAVGIGLLIRRSRASRGPTAHDHDGGHDHGLTELPEGVSPLSVRGVVIIGLAGGLIPSPSAFLVIATALFLDRLLFGLALVAAFSVGLAATITAIGVLALTGRDVLARHRAARPALSAAVTWVPTIAALVVVAGGVWLTAVGVGQLP